MNVVGQRFSNPGAQVQSFALCALRRGAETSRPRDLRRCTQGVPKLHLNIFQNQLWDQKDFFAPESCLEKFSLKKSKPRPKHPLKYDFSFLLKSKTYSVLKPYRSGNFSALSFITVVTSKKKRVFLPKLGGAVTLKGEGICLGNVIDQKSLISILKIDSENIRVDILYLLRELY